jgi:predicted lipoprotein with Yx(FWY)xxD motif
MSPRSESSPRRRFLTILAIAAACLAVGIPGLALAGTFTVKVAKSTVTNAYGSSRTEKIVVNPGGFALYELTGDSKAHPKCTSGNGCTANWPPATVKSASGLTKGPGVPGKLGVWRHNGIKQLTLAGHPLYRYVIDIHARDATGQGVHADGGTWHVIPGTS